MVFRQFQVFLAHFFFFFFFFFFFETFPYSAISMLILFLIYYRLRNLKGN